MHKLAFLALSPLALNAAPALNPDVLQDTIHETICVPGYTKTIRPPVSQTNKIKRQMMDKQGLDQSIIPYFALDHIIPMALGEHPSDPSNLQLISHKENSKKSRFEVKLQCLVCTGQMTLKEAQRMMPIWEEVSSKMEWKKCRR